MPNRSAISVFEDRDEAGEWRVKYVDEDGGCYVTIFAGPIAEPRARAYFRALNADGHPRRAAFLGRPELHPLERAGARPKSSPGISLWRQS